jgi:hypothetical protein
VQPSENKLFSKIVSKMAVLAAYLMRGLFLYSQSAYGKWLKIVHSSKNKKVSENANKKPLSRCLDLERVLSCTLTTE